jgi:hypothetical protein
MVVGKLKFRRNLLAQFLNNRDLLHTRDRQLFCPHLPPNQRASEPSTKRQQAPGTVPRPKSSGVLRAERVGRRDLASSGARLSAGVAQPRRAPTGWKATRPNCPVGDVMAEEVCAETSTSACPCHITMHTAVASPSYAVCTINRDQPQRTQARNQLRH